MENSKYLIICIGNKIYRKHNKWCYRDIEPHSPFTFFTFNIDYIHWNPFKEHEESDSSSLTLNLNQLSESDAKIKIEHHKRRLIRIDLSASEITEKIIKFIEFCINHDDASGIISVQNIEAIDVINKSEPIRDAFIANNNFKFKIIRNDVPEKNDLECTRWFKYFYNHECGSGSGAIIQTCGTCYCNAFINLIILTPYLKHYVSSRINDDTNSMFVKINNILNPTAITRLPIHVKERRAESVATELEIECYKYGIIPSTGKGGNTLKLAENFLTLIEPEWKNDIEIKQIDTYQSDTTNLLGGLIALYFKEGPGHAITGFFCGGIPKIYDSSMHVKTVDCNWINHSHIIHVMSNYYKDIRFVRVYGIYKK